MYRVTIELQIHADSYHQAYHAACDMMEDATEGFEDPVGLTPEFYAWRPIMNTEAWDAEEGE